MIYLTYSRHLNLAGSNACITSISFALLATDEEVSVRRHDSCHVSLNWVLKMLWMCLSFWRILSLHRCLPTPLVLNDLQAPAFPGDATKVHGSGCGFLQDLANQPTVIARVSGVSFLQQAMWNLNSHHLPYLKLTVVYTEGGKLQNEGLLVEKGIYYDGWRAFLAQEAAGFPVAIWPQGSGQTSHLDHAPVWWLQLTELRVWPLGEY